jgi:MFS family permease
MALPGAALRRLSHPLSTHLERMCGVLAPRRLAGLRWFWREGIFVQAAESFSADYIPLFALAAGATPPDIGLLAAAANLLSLAGFMPGALLASLVRTRKAAVLSTSYGPSRLMLPLMAVLPLLFPSGPVLVFLIIGLNALRIFGGSLGNPAWTSFVADLVPAETRGRFFASRLSAGGITALAVSPLAGLIIRTVNGSSHHALPGYQVSLCAAFLAGSVSVAFFLRIPEPPARRVSRPLRQIRGLAVLLRRDRAFTWLALSSFVWGLGTTMAGSFINVFIVTALGGTAASVGITAGVFALCGLFAQLVFGRLSDRRGNRWILVVTGLAIPVLPCLWATARIPLHGYLINVPSGFLWAGYSLASFNILLEMSPAEDRESAFALYQTVVAAGAVIGPILGGSLAGVAGFRPVFVLSGIVRLAATILFLVFVRPRRAITAPGAPEDPGFPGWTP